MPEIANLFAKKKGHLHQGLSIVPGTVIARGTAPKQSRFPREIASLRSQRQSKDSAIYLKTHFGIGYMGKSCAVQLRRIYCLV